MVLFFASFKGKALTLSSHLQCLTAGCDYSRVSSAEGAWYHISRSLTSARVSQSPQTLHLFLSRLNHDRSQKRQPDAIPPKYSWDLFDQHECCTTLWSHEGRSMILGVSIKSPPSLFSLCHVHVQCPDLQLFCQTTQLSPEKGPHQFRLH